MWVAPQRYWTWLSVDEHRRKTTGALLEALMRFAPPRGSFLQLDQQWSERVPVSLVMLLAISRLQRLQLTAYDHLVVVPCLAAI